MKDACVIKRVLSLQQVSGCAGHVSPGTTGQDEHWGASMSRTLRLIFVAAGVLGCWVVYAILAFAAEKQRLPDGGYGELYGPVAWLRDGFFWIGVVVSVLSVAALPVLLRGRANVSAPRSNH